MTIDDKRLRFWAEHECDQFDCHDREDHAERRELVREVIRFRDSYIEANDALGEAEAKLDALTAALIPIAKEEDSYIAEKQTIEGRQAIKVLNIHVPDWRSR